MWRSPGFPGGKREKESYVPSPSPAARAGLDSALQPAALSLKPFYLAEKKTLAPAGARLGHHLHSCQVFTSRNPDHVGSV